MIVLAQSFQVPVVRQYPPSLWCHVDNLAFTRQGIVRFLKIVLLPDPFLPRRRLKVPRLLNFLSAAGISILF